MFTVMFWIYFTSGVVPMQLETTTAEEKICVTSARILAKELIEIEGVKLVNFQCVRTT